MSRHRLNILITGMPCSNFEEVAQYLTSYGLHTKHEGIFTERRAWEFLKEKTVDWDCEHKAEIAWRAAPWISAFNGTVLHFTRTPRKVIERMYHSGMLDEGSEAMRFFTEFLPAPKDYERETMQRWAAGLYVSWNRSIEQYAVGRGLSYIRMRIEKLNTESVIKVLGLLGVTPSHRSHSPISIDFDKDKASGSFMTIESSCQAFGPAKLYRYVHEELYYQVINYKVRPKQGPIVKP